MQQASLVKQILTAFSDFSGLQINYHKSTFVPIHMCAEEALAAASVLGCPISSLPCNYLGLPLSMQKVSNSVLMPVIQKIDRRLAGWLATYLSWGGRLTMIDDVLSSIPNYYMAFIKWNKNNIAKKV